MTSPTTQREAAQHSYREAIEDCKALIEECIARMNKNDYEEGIVISALANFKLTICKLLEAKEPTE